MTNAALADALATLIGSMVTTAGGTMSRRWTPRDDIKDLGALTVTVVPPRVEVWDQAARVGWYRDRELDVDVKQVVKDDDAADTLGALVETLTEYIGDTPIATQGLVGMTVRSCEPMSLDEKKVFWAIITPRYRELIP